MNFAINSAGWTFIIGIYSLGYLIGSRHPMRRLNDWNWRRMMWGARANWADVALFGAFHPGKALHVWRTRNDPPPTYTVPTIGPRWANRDPAGAPTSSGPNL